MEIYPDFREFLQLLNEESVEYLVGGGYAVTFHGYPRYTGDIDIWINPTEENATRMMTVLDRFGAGSVGIEKGDFLDAHFDVLKMGNEPIRIDMMVKMKGLEFEAAYARRVVENIEGLNINFLSLDDLVMTKKASNRSKDQNDLEHLPGQEGEGL